MKRKKSFLVSLVVVLSLALVALWVSFATGRFGLVADLILQTGVRGKQEFTAQEIFKESYFNNLILKNNVIKLANNFVFPDTADISSKIESNLNFSLPANEISVETNLGVRTRRRNTFFTILSVTNKTQNYIAPLKIKLPNINVDNPEMLEIYSYNYTQWTENNDRYIYVNQLDPLETRIIPLLTLGISQEKIRNEFLKQITFYGNELDFSLAEEKNTTECNGDSNCNLKLEAKWLTNLGQYAISTDSSAASVSVSSVESSVSSSSAASSSSSSVSSSSTQATNSEFCSNLEKRIELIEKTGFVIPKQKETALFTARTLYAIFCSQYSSDEDEQGDQTDQNGQDEQNGQEGQDEDSQQTSSNNFYLKKLLLRVENTNNTLSRAEIGLKINESDLNIVPFLGTIEDGVWYLPAEFLFTEKNNNKNIAQVNAWFLSNKDVPNSKIQLFNLRTYKGWPANTSTSLKAKLELLNVDGPDNLGRPLSAVERDLYSLNNDYKTAHFKVRPVGKTEDYYITENGVFVSPGDKIEKYQKVLFVPYLSNGDNSNKLKKLINSENWLDFGNDKTGDGFYYIYPQSSIKNQIIPLERFYSKNDQENDFYKGDYAFYGLKYYKGYVWFEITFPEPKQNYELIFSWDKPSSETGEMFIQARSKVNQQFSPWVNFKKDIKSIKVVAGTEKLQLRLFLEGESADSNSIRGISGITLISSGSGSGSEESTTPTISGNVAPDSLSSSLISTGTHLLLLLIISIILVVSIVYIIALLKEK